MSARESLGEGRYLEGVEEPCGGSSDCRAVRHIHGCFADDGNCDDPGEHMAPGLGKFFNKLAKQEPTS